jgi:hypothetical protein
MPLIFLFYRITYFMLSMATAPTGSCGGEIQPNITSNHHFLGTNTPFTQLNSQNTTDKTELTQNKIPAKHGRSSAHKLPSHHSVSLYTEQQGDSGLSVSSATAAATSATGKWWEEDGSWWRSTQLKIGQPRSWPLYTQAALTHMYAPQSSRRLKTLPAPLRPRRKPIKAIIRYHYKQELLRPRIKPRLFHSRHSLKSSAQSRKMKWQNGVAVFPLKFENYTVVGLIPIPRSHKVRSDNEYGHTGCNSMPDAQMF